MCDVVWDNKVAFHARTTRKCMITNIRQPEWQFKCSRHITTSAKGVTADGCDVTWDGCFDGAGLSVDVFGVITSKRIFTFRSKKTEHETEEPEEHSVWGVAGMRKKRKTNQKQTRNKPETNQKQTRNKPETNQKQTRNKPETNQKQTRNKPETMERERKLQTSRKPRALRGVRSWDLVVC